VPYAHDVNFHSAKFLKNHVNIDIEHTYGDQKTRMLAISLACQFPTESYDYKIWKTMQQCSEEDL